MNYRHAYHAGNFADVLKHAVLMLCLEHLKRKEAAFRVIDTHAGAGHYPLDGAETSKTGEWRAGIQRVLDASARAPGPVKESLAGYLAAVRRDSDAAGTLRAYGGSPALMAASLRAGDVLVANELHADDHATLKRVLAGDRQAKVMMLDAWIALKALLPPPERRGLILIDPPFEQPGELIRMTEGLDAALARFKTGTYLLWYPIKDTKPVERFRRAIRELAARRGLASVLDCELLLRSPRHPEVLNGCGLIVVNPPYTLAAQLDNLLPWLAETLGVTGDASGRVVQMA